MKTPKFTDSKRQPRGGYRPASESDVRVTFRLYEREQQAKREPGIFDVPQRKVA